MQVNPYEYQKRQAYLIGFAEAKTLQGIPSIDRYLDEFKQGLLSWGFQEQDVLSVLQESEIPDFDKDEFERIENI